MKPPPQAVQTEGHGPAVVFIHGTAADKTSWRALIALIRGRVRATVYDRRGTSRWPIGTLDPPPVVSDHADDAADVIVGLGSAPVYIRGLSFGAVVAVELMRRRPELVRGAVLFEPALAADDDGSPVPRDLLDAVERLVATGQVKRAGEYFCRHTIGTTAWNLLPGAVRNDMRSRGLQIRDDLQANAAYAVCYQGLAEIAIPVLLLKGGRSGETFEPTLASLHRALRRSERGIIERAEHVPYGDAWREFAETLTGFVRA